MKRFLVGFLLLTLVLSVSGETPKEDRWSFSAGFRQRYNIDTDVSGGRSRSAANYGVHPGRVPLVTGMPPLTGTADREYDDGFVYRDVGTDDPASVAPGATGFYGYQNASQVAGGSLNFSRSASVLNGRSSASFQEAEDQAAGIEFRLNYRILERDRFSLHAVMTTAYFPEQENHFQWSDYSANRVTSTVTDQYDLNGVDPSARQGANPDPNDPDWSWLENYTPGDPRPHPLINNEPDRRLMRADSGQVYRNNVQYDVEYDMATLGFGLELQWEMTRRVSLYVSPRIERCRMDIDASRTETLFAANGAVVDRWNDRSSDHEYFWGAALGGGAQISITDRLFFRVHADALKTWDSVDAQTGPTSLAMDMSGWSWGCDLGFEF